jgi:hypothetical protein
METYSTDIETTLMRQLEKVGIESDTISLFIKDLVYSFSEDPSMSLFEVNCRLHFLGWDDIKVELDYHTFLLAKACFENDSLKSLQV